VLCLLFSNVFLPYFMMNNDFHEYFNARSLDVKGIM